MSFSNENLYNFKHTKNVQKTKEFFILHFASPEAAFHMILNSDWWKEEILQYWNAFARTFNFNYWNCFFNNKTWQAMSMKKMRTKNEFLWWNESEWNWRVELFYNFYFFILLSRHHIIIIRSIKVEFWNE
jgi:hypothetical protein